MSQSPSPDSTGSSVQSSPLAGRESRHSECPNALPTSDDVVLVPDSVGKAGATAVSGPGMYYVSPSQPEKRRQLRVRSPRVATMSMFAGGRRLTSSIPGYGGAVKKALRRRENSVYQSTSPTSVGQGSEENDGCPTDPALSGPVVSSESDPAIPVSGIGLPRPGSNTFLLEQSDMAQACPPLPATDSLLQQAEARRNCVVKLFEGVGGTSAEGHQKSGAGSDIGKVPVRRRVAVSEHLSTLEFVKLKRSIVISDLDSASDGEEENPIDSVIRQVLGTEPLDDEEVFFHSPVGGHFSNPTSPSADGGSGGNSRGFRGKEKSTQLGEKERKQMIRKDNVTTSMLDKSKMKEIFQYPCCDRMCLSNFGLEQIIQHRRYYFGLKHVERNVVLRGCLEKTLQGRTGYCVNGKRICRNAFKKLYSVGNDRLQRVSRDIFFKIENDVFRKEKSSVSLSFVQWMTTFLSKHVESLPNKDLFHLPDNWTKGEVFEMFKVDLLEREETTMTYGYFCRLWLEEFPRVRIPEHSHFTACTPCTEFKHLRDKATLEVEKSKSTLTIILLLETKLIVMI